MSRPTSNRPGDGSRQAHRALLGFSLSAILATLPSLPAAGQTPEEFYKGKTISIMVGIPPGGGYDLNARLLARHLGRHIPGKPAVIVQNLPGGGGHLMAVRHLDMTGKKDGTEIALHSMGLATQAVVDPESGEIDLRKVSYLGSLSSDVVACYTWHTLGVKNWEDLKKHELRFGAAGKSSYSYQAPAVLKNMFGLKTVIALGYPGNAELAVESGELNAKCGSWLTTSRSWLADKKIDMFIRFSAKLPADMPASVPSANDLAKSEEEKKLLDFIFSVGDVARPFAVSKDTPPERLAALRAAFEATMKDPAFLADAEKSKLTVDYATAKEVEQVVKNVYATPPELVAKVKALLK
jgi:tripartite-type tricarboxylate transporter receptor subunit TctC